ncbi:c-type cytochrome [Sulfurimonas marina]|uniref:C-type cytochrome n=1 Tax=Sulfurimonas marina TaxID=2590551 RepID=A0A7M1AWK7_9BACT|nr:c-type cytochrome [Sulfurimonas marina]QOP41829.1 c-type cytochrome [Sulfurimonas marina]
MYFKLLLLGTLLTFTACNEHHQSKNLDGEKLLKEKCSSCHNIDLPPKTFEDEKAPPMMAVVFHVRNFTEINVESQRVPKAIEFVKDYALYPSISKAFCDKESLKSYGLMPSQKGLVSEDELEAIAVYMFEHFTQENLEKEQRVLRKYNAMTQGEKIAIKNNCLGCHRVEKDLMGPSFKKIADKYKNDEQKLKTAIRNGGNKMPPYTNLSDKELQDLSKFIYRSLKK